MIARAAPGRRAEFHAGRSAARRALLELSQAPPPFQASKPLMSHPAGDPIWPHGIVGSISHTRGWAIAAVARIDQLAGLGLDLEGAEPLDADLVDFVCRPEERAIDRGLVERGIDGAKLRFVTKEAWYKAVYPASRRFVGFDEAIVAVDAITSRFEVRFVGDVSGDDRAIPPTAGGYFLQSGDLLCAVCALPAQVQGQGGAPAWPE